MVSSTTVQGRIRIAMIAIAVAALSDRGTSFAACPDFAPTVNYAAGLYPQALATADLNGDLIPDLAVANFDGDNLSIFYGNANGTFNAAVTVAAGGADSSPIDVAIADLNGDLIRDLAVANHFGNNVSILLANGSGGFAAAVNYAAGTNPWSLVLADLDNDAKLDIAVANRGSGNVSALIGNGDGTFDAAVHYAAGLLPYSVAAGDLNGDLKPDLAVTNYDSGDVSILLGNGNGTFAAATNFAVGGGPTSVAIANFNSDSALDLVVVDYEAYEVLILLGSGTGSFAAPVSYDTGPLPYSVAVGDINGDGRADVAAGTDANVSILLGNGDGTLAPSVDFAVDDDSADAVLGDFNGDNKPDVATANQSSGTISVLLSTCVGSDLAIAKTHTGDFAQGNTGRTYTITVSNVGAADSIGTVTVTDALPSGLTATALTGPGWNCNLATLKCTNTNVLSPTFSYGDITLTVSVHSDAPANVTNTATVSGGGQFNFANDSASDPTTVTPSPLIAPTNVIATATSASQVSVTWNPVTDATSYQVLRSPNISSAFAVVGNPSTANFTDTTVSANTTYLYRVQAVGATTGPASNFDPATTVVLTDDPLTIGVTSIKAAHLTQLRTAVNAFRAAAGLSTATFTDAVAPGVTIRAVHVNELRTNLNAARTALGLSAINYTDPSLSAGFLVKAAHVQQLRAGVK